MEMDKAKREKSCHIGWSREQREFIRRSTYQEKGGDIINRRVYLWVMVITYATLVVFVLFVSLW